jgi:predicted DNA-binding protein
MKTNTKVKPLVQVRLDKKLHSKLSKLAREKYISNASLVRSLIVKHLEEVG